jgi:hypothetical protein
MGDLWNAGWPSTQAMHPEAAAILIKGWNLVSKDANNAKAIATCQDVVTMPMRRIRNVPQ